MRLAAAVALVALALTLPAAGATGFTPKLLAGTWSGSWVNETFGSTGPAQIVAAAPKNTRLLFTVDFGGNVFGCEDPPPGKGGLTKGRGANHWNAAGFTIKRASAAFGTTTLVYTHKNKRLRGSGMNPTCSPDLKWKIDGTFSGNTFAGTIQITLPGGAAAVSKLTLKRG